MAPKRKSDAMEQVTLDLPPVAVLADSKEVNINASAVAEPVAKKSRVADASTSKGKAKAKAAPRDWQDIKLDGEDEDGVPIYDDCNDIRRKIRALQKTPGWKLTPWLRDIGGINNNSYGRFMKCSGPSEGATNGTYKAAYIFFEKQRIADGKKKTPKRERNEQEFPRGMPLEDRRKGWVMG